jgi:hypothetical protein
MPENKESETQDNIASDTQPEEEEEKEGEEYTRTEANNESEPLKDVIESDQAVEPDVKVAEELRTLQEKEDMVTAYAASKILIPESTVSKKQQRRQKHQRRQRQQQRRQQQKETSTTTNTTLINISRQLDKQATEIKRISSILQSIQKHIKLLERQRSEFIKLIQKQTSQIQKYVTKNKSKSKSKNKKKSKNTT